MRGETCGRSGLGESGGVGTALVQTARANGIRVVGIVSSDAKRDFALAAGADVVIQRNREEVRAAVMRATDGRGVDILGLRSPRAHRL